MDSQDVIDRAHQILRTNGIHRGDYATNVDGELMPISDPAATQFCSVGAVARATYELIGHENFTPAYTEAIARLQAVVNAQAGAEVSITAWNDHYATDEEIYATFEKMSTPTMIPVAALH